MSSMNCHVTGTVELVAETGGGAQLYFWANGHPHAKNGIFETPHMPIVQFEARCCLGKV